MSATHSYLSPTSLSRPPIIGFSAYSGTGKTTLLTRLIPLLKAQGLRLAVIKHAHHRLELDTPGKDSYRFREAGAGQVVLASWRRLALMQEYALDDRASDPSLEKALALVDNQHADLILVEGFKHATFPKIELHRPALKKPLLFPQDNNIIALATDAPLPDTQIPATLPLLDINDAQRIVDFIMQSFDFPMAPSPNSENPPHLSTSDLSKLDGQRSVKHTVEQQAEPEHPLQETGKPSIKTAISCADAYDPESMPFSQAGRHILEQVRPVQSIISLPLRDAQSRILAVDIHSPVNVPAHTNAAMDGYALAGVNLPTEAIKTFDIAGTALAGQPVNTPCRPEQCIRIMTGAMMPAGTDTVVMQEQTELLNAQQVRIAPGHQAGQNVRQAGEDIGRGQTVLSRGHHLLPADIGLLASLGLGEVKVYRAPRVAFFSTGDELRSLGEPLESGCVYDSNRYTLHSMLSTLGVDILDFGVVRDQPEALKATLQEAASQADVVISSGGVSVGEADYTRAVLSDVGQVDFWKIAIKPGRPLAFGHIGDALFFGLPGNPVAVMVTFIKLVQPALLKLAGETHHTPLILQATCQEKLRKKPGRSEFIRAIVSQRADGRLQVCKAGHQGSGILTSMSRANALIILDEDNSGVEIGDQVAVQPIVPWSQMNR